MGKEQLQLLIMTTREKAKDFKMKQEVAKTNHS